MSRLHAAYNSHAVVGQGLEMDSTTTGVAKAFAELLVSYQDGHASRKARPYIINQLATSDACMRALGA